MAEKKKEKETIKKTATKKEAVVPSKIKAKTLVKEDVYPAREIAEDSGISQFAFHIMKQEAGIDDGSFLTIDEFQKIYKKVIGR